MRDVAAVTARGRRDHLEDFVRVEQPFAGGADVLYAAVFDGHDGEAVSLRASREMHGRVAAEMESGRPVEAAIREAFRAFDEDVAGEAGGTTAAVAVLQGRGLTVANAGDSHVLLVSRGGGTVLTTDHRLTSGTEFRRVVAAGARIQGPYVCLPDGRGLMCTRSLGDRELRGVGVIPEPALDSRPLAVEDEWLVLASDGVWDGLDAGTVARLAREAPTARLAANRIRDAALAASPDNVGVVAVRLP